MNGFGTEPILFYSSIVKYIAKLVDDEKLNFNEHRQKLIGILVDRIDFFFEEHRHDALEKILGKANLRPERIPKTRAKLLNDLTFRKEMILHDLNNILNMLELDKVMVEFKKFAKEMEMEGSESDRLALEIKSELDSLVRETEDRSESKIKGRENVINFEHYKKNK